MGDRAPHGTSHAALRCLHLGNRELGAGIQGVVFFLAPRATPLRDWITDGEPAHLIPFNQQTCQFLVVFYSDCENWRGIIEE